MVFYYFHCKLIHGKIWIIFGSLLPNLIRTVQILLNCYSISCHTVCAITESFSISWDKLFYSLFIQICVLCYRQSCHNSLHSAIIFKSVVTKILLQHCEHNNRWATDSPRHSQCGFFSYEITRHVKLFSDQLYYYFEEHGWFSSDKNVVFPSCWFFFVLFASTFCVLS
jgi:hypothetical protein